MKFKHKFIVVPAIFSMFFTLAPASAAEDDIITFGEEFGDKTEQAASENPAESENTPNETVVDNPSNEPLPTETPSSEIPISETPVVETPIIERPIEIVPKDEDKPAIETPGSEVNETSDRSNVGNKEANPIPSEISQPISESLPKNVEKINANETTENLIEENDSTYDLGEVINFDENLGNVNNFDKDFLNENENAKDFTNIPGNYKDNSNIDDIGKEKRVYIPEIEPRDNVDNISQNPKIENENTKLNEDFYGVPEKNDENSGNNKYIKPVPKNDSQNQRARKARFVKLMSDDSYDYYLDRNAVRWIKLPYSSSEYMADVWIRMIDKSPNGNEDMPSDLYDYINNVDDEISEAAAKGISYDEVDVKVLRTKKYFLEHYYIRPKTQQIQFLCELEVVGRPQNAISERAYDYKNWESLIPGSVEFSIYHGVLSTIGKSGASSRGHMTFVDMLDEYARIALN